MRKRKTPKRSIASYPKPIQESLVDTVRLGDKTETDPQPTRPLPHDVEREVQRQLLAHPELKFTSLFIHRTRNGVCLEGVLEADDDSLDICSLVQRVAGVDEVLNHLVVRRPAKVD